MTSSSLVKKSKKSVNVEKFFGKKTNEVNSSKKSVKANQKNSSVSSIKLFYNNFSEAFSGESFSNDNDKLESKNLYSILISINTNVIKIKSILNKSYLFNKKVHTKKQRDDERKRYKEKESRLESTEKKDNKIKISKDISPSFSFIDTIKRFIFFTILGAIYDKIVPLIPTLGKVASALGGVADFALELFGGITHVLTKFLAQGIRLVNGITRSFAVISGAKTEEEISAFEKKFNTMIDLSILAAILAGNSLSDIFDIFRKNKNKPTKKPTKSRGIKRTFSKIGGRKGSKFLNKTTKQIKNFANKSTGNIFARGKTRSLTRLGAKVAGKKGASLVKGAGKNLGKFGGPIATVALAAWDFSDRKSSGQSNIQAGAGTAAGVGGALAGAKGGAALGAAIGSIVPGVGTVIGGVLGGALGAAGGAWAASKAADKITGADKVQGLYKGGLINGYRNGGLIRPNKTKPQETKPGKDVGGYYEIIKLFPDPELKGKSGQSESIFDRKTLWSYLNPFSLFSGSQTEVDSQDSSMMPNSLKSLRDTSDIFKKIPFIGDLMGLAVDISMGQKPDKIVYNQIAKNLVYLSQRLSTSKNISSITDIKTDIQKLESGGIASEINKEFLSVKFTEKSVQEISNTISVAIETGANDALTKIRKEILTSKVESLPRRSNQQHDHGYDQNPSSGTYENTSRPSEDGRTTSTGSDAKLLTFISKGEGGYNSMNQGTRGGRIVGSTHNASTILGKNLTDMTVEEVMSHQSAGRLFAAGRYQIIPSTMKLAVQRSGVSKTSKFDIQTQDKLGLALIYNGQRPTLSAYLQGRSNDLRGAMLDLALEWASVPHPDTGRSAYPPANKSSHSVEEVRQALINARRGRQSQSASSSSQASTSQRPVSYASSQGHGLKQASHPQTGSGWTIEGQTDYRGRPVVFSKEGALAFSKMIKDSKGAVTGRDIASSQRSRSHNTRVGGAQNSTHLFGRGMDIHGSSRDWIKRHGSRYGWAHAPYGGPRDHGGHFEFRGPTTGGGRSGGGGIESRFHGGLVNKDSLVRIHAGEFVVDKDSVDIFGIDFFEAANKVENLITLKKISPILFNRIDNIIKGSFGIIPEFKGVYTQSELVKSSKKTTKNLENFITSSERKTKESLMYEEKEDFDTSGIQVVPGNHPQTGSGFMINGVNDGNQRPLILAKGAITSFGKMMKVSKGQVKGSDVASGQRSKLHNRRVGGVENSNHLFGNALDIHGSSQSWMRRNGKSYGWFINDYPGSHGGHFDYKGKDADDSGNTFSSRSTSYSSSNRGPSLSNSGSLGIGSYASGVGFSGVGFSGGGSSRGGFSGGGRSRSGGSSSEDGFIDVHAEPSESLVPGISRSKESKFKPAAPMSGGAIEVDDKLFDKLFKEIGASAEDWDIFRNTIAYIESKGVYDIAGGSGGHYDGRYQMGSAAKIDAARVLGIPNPGHNNAARAAYRNNPELQEKMFAAFTIANHRFLMRNNQYKNASVERKLEILGYAHNQGMGNAERWLNTGEVGVDGFGTKGTKFTDSIAANFRARNKAIQDGTYGDKDNENKQDSTGSISVGDYTIDTKNEFLKAAGTGKLKHGRADDGLCTTNVLLGLDKLGHTFAPEGTTADSSNPRGLVSQLIGKNDFTSIPGLGNEQTIKSPYGDVQARVVPFKDFQEAVDKGLIPSGAFIFSTKHNSWNDQTGSSSGFDTAISRDGGKIAWNGTGSSGNAIYGDSTQSIIVLVPKSSIIKTENSDNVESKLKTEQLAVKSPQSAVKSLQSAVKSPQPVVKPKRGGRREEKTDQPGSKPKQNWIQSAASNVLGFFGMNKNSKVAKAESGGQIGKPNISRRGINKFAGYENPVNQSPLIIYQEKITYINNPDTKKSSRSMSFRSSGHSIDNTYHLRRN